MKTVTPDDLRQLVEYDAETGAFLWKHRERHWFRADDNWRQWNTKYAGTPALRSRNRDGYLQGRILGITLKAHRAAIAITTGAWPSDQVDHINGVKSDNRLANLREVSRTENQRNARISKANKSGRTGVCLYRPTGKWAAHIRVDKKTVTLGYFDEFQDAVAAREAAEAKYGFYPNSRRTAARVHAELAEKEKEG